MEECEIVDTHIVDYVVNKATIKVRLKGAEPASSTSLQYNGKFSIGKAIPRTLTFMNTAFLLQRARHKDIAGSMHHVIKSRKSSHAFSGQKKCKFVYSTFHQKFQ